jgi:predicted HNH restriction endonuclease
MATANKNTKTIEIGRFTIEFDACEDGFNWHVMDADGDCVESYEEQADAIEDAKAMEDQAQEEEEEEDAEEAQEEARDEIRGLLDDADAETLAAVLALLKR